MSIAALQTPMHSHGGMWRSWRWLVPVTALFMIANYALPWLQASGIPVTTVRLGINAAIVLGLWLGLERAELTPRQRLGTFLGVIVPFTLWLASIWSLATNGVFRPEFSPLPYLPLAILLPVIIGVPLVLMSRRLGEVLDAMPETWLIGLQVYRVLGSLFLVGWLNGLVPGVFALPASIGDTITGLLALPVAMALAADPTGQRKAAMAWNVFGLLDFTVAVSIGMLISPGPLQVIVPSIPNAALAAYPAVMIPAFAVPSSILLHVLSLRQLRRRVRQAAA